MYAVCLRYARHEQEAQDMLQEGSILVFDRLSAFREEGPLEGWVRRIMVHVAVNHYRRKAFQQERLGMEHPPETPVPCDALEQLSERERLGLVASLPDG